MRSLIKLLAIFLAFSMLFVQIPWDNSSYAFAEEFVVTNVSSSDTLRYIEESVYETVIEELDSDIYFVENVSVVYISSEYLEEVAYNSQSNIYFGYTLEELNTCFQGTRYVFALGEDGETVVHEFENYDDTYDQVVRNIAIGVGVILICVTVALVAAPFAPAVSMVFAVAAKVGAITAVSEGLVSGVVGGAVTLAETGDTEQALKAAALYGSEGFKWGAITGSIAGGASEVVALRGATLNGLSMNEAAILQRDTGLPLAYIKNFHSMDEYNVYKNAGLLPVKVNGEWAYVQKVDWQMIDDSGLSNVERVTNNMSPIGPDGKPFELHHVGQKSDSPLAILTNTEHHSNHSILHINAGAEIGDGANRGYEWAKRKHEFWMDYMEMSIDAP